MNGPSPIDSYSLIQERSNAVFFANMFDIEAPTCVCYK